MSKVTMVQGEVPYYLFDEDGNRLGINPEYPHHGRCKSGHTLDRTGPDVRFFAISGKVVPKHVEGVYCEHCLSVANRMSALDKQGLGGTIDPEAELRKLINKAE